MSSLPDSVPAYIKELNTREREKCVQSDIVQNEHRIETKIKKKNHVQSSLQSSLVGESITKWGNIIIVYDVQV